MTNLKRQGAIAFLWDFTGKIANQGVGLIISIILARLLEPAEFGLIAMVMVFIGVAGIFTDIGLGSALIQRRHVLPIHYSSVFFFNISLGALMTLLMYFSAVPIADFYRKEAIEPIVHVVAFSFLISSFGAVQSTKLRKELNYKALTKARFFSSLLSGIVGAAMAFYGFGVWSLVVQMLTSQLLYVIFVWSASGWIPTLGFSFKALKNLWAFGFRMFLSGLLDAIFSRLDYIFIGRLFPADTLGYFQRAKSLNMLAISYSSGSLMSVLFPLLSKIHTDLPRFRNVVLKGMGLISFAIFFLLGVLYVTSHDLIILLFGQKWEPSVEFFQILALSGFGYPLSALMVNVLSSRGNSKAFLRLEIYKKILGLTNIAALYIGGINAFLYYLVFSSSMAVLLNAWFVKKEIGLGIIKQLKPAYYQSIFAIISALSVEFLLKEFTFIPVFGIVAKGIIFLLFYWFLNHFFKSDSYFIFLNTLTPILNRIKNRFGM